MTDTTTSTITKLGYARASTDDQDCSIQVQALQAAGCGLIRSEKKSSVAIFIGQRIRLWRVTCIQE